VRLRARKKTVAPAADEIAAYPDDAPLLQENRTGLAGFTPPYAIHLGCNRHRLPGWVNVDARATEATDIVHDCRDLAPFADKTVNAVFSHAFFEHLTLHGRAALLKEIHRVLTEDGLLYFCGVPDFEIVARSYLERRPGHGAPRFDAIQAYRYTHGYPEEQSDWWLEQLHKTLFDVETVKALLTDAGFGAHYVYRYAFGDEANSVNLGFMARKNPQPFGDAEVLAIIRLFAKFNRPNFDNIELGL
jgi:predicted SAM-dependent methyltransferase